MPVPKGRTRRPSSGYGTVSETVSFDKPIHDWYTDLATSQAKAFSFVIDDALRFYKAHVEAKLAQISAPDAPPEPAATEDDDSVEL